MHVTFCEHKSRRHYGISVGDKSFERMEQFKYLGMALINQNPTHEVIKSKLKSGNACYHSVQNLVSSSLLLTVKRVKYAEL